MKKKKIINDIIIEIKIFDNAEIVSLVDSDEHGRKFNRDNGFKDAERLILEGVKDWNDLLLKRNTGSGVEAVV